MLALDEVFGCLEWAAVKIIYHKGMGRSYKLVQTNPVACISPPSNPPLQTCVMAIPGREEYSYARHRLVKQAEV